MTINEMLTKYNALAARHNEPGLKTWKAKKSDLETKYEELRKSVNAQLQKEQDDYEANGGKKKAKKKTKAEGLSVADIARSMNMNPKVARAKLRRKGLTAQNGRWGLVQKGSAEYKQIRDALK